MSSDSQAPGRWSNIAVEDWDLLFCAVRLRLREAVGESLRGPDAPLGTALLECVEALDQLHLALQQALADPVRIDALRARVIDQIETVPASLPTSATVAAGPRTRRV